MGLTVDPETHVHVAVLTNSTAGQPLPSLPSECLLSAVVRSDDPLGSFRYATTGAMTQPIRVLVALVPGLTPSHDQTSAVIAGSRRLT